MSWRKSIFVISDRRCSDWTSVGLAPQLRLSEPEESPNIVKNGRRATSRISPKHTRQPCYPSSQQASFIIHHPPLIPPRSLRLFVCCIQEPSLDSEGSHPSFAISNESIVNAGATVHPTNVQSPKLFACCHSPLCTTICGLCPLHISLPSITSLTGLPSSQDSESCNGAPA